MIAPYADRVRVVELDSGLPVHHDVQVVLYDTFGQPQGAALKLDDVLAGQDAKVVVFSWNTDEDLVRESLEAGAAGYVSKGLSGAELVDVVLRVHRGETVTPRVDRDEPQHAGRWPGQEHGLSPREAEVLALICEGLSNDEITQRAFIGINTVKTYIRTLYAKIGVESRTQAVLWGVDHGFRRDVVRRTASGAPVPAEEESEDLLEDAAGGDEL
ncbi:MAG: helix-turn-helix transcriptional regulator [Nocardioides sp.]|nr:helix-turn-helix transcriptional regulator [Nocardioides sp.]